MPAALFVKEADTGRFVLYNSPAEQLFGVPRETLIGRTSEEVFSQDKARRFGLQDQALDVGVRGVSAEQILHDERGSERIIRIKKVAIGDEEAVEKRYIIAIAEFITEEKLR